MPPCTLGGVPVPVRFHVETLGCPKNAVDSDKVVASLVADGLTAADGPDDADLIVVNTCAFIEAARAESVEVANELAAGRKPGARLVLTGCMAERYGEELRAAVPAADAVVGFADEGSIAPVVLRGRKPVGVRDLLELPRPAPRAPWAYVKVAEGCDRTCAFCAIPSFRGKQRSRHPDALVGEARSLVEGGARELVLVAQDLASYGRDAGERDALVGVLHRIDALRADGLARVRLLYLYPSELRDPLLATMLALESVVPYFDLSLQHASQSLLRRMRRWGSGDRFLGSIATIRAAEPDAAFRSSFIVGFPGESEDDHDELVDFLHAAELDWAGLFPFSKEDGTRAAELDREVPAEIMGERLRELSEVQDRISQARRDALLGARIDVLVDEMHGTTAVGRTYREAPEIDGVVHVVGAPAAAPGMCVMATVTDALGPDLEAVP
jgi:ribosomal protein S12 methylthiotransferase